VVILVGQIVGRPAGGLAMDVHRMLDERGRTLSEKSVRLELPWAKVDHLLVHETA
jgi:hypothetical protein